MPDSSLIFAPRPSSTAIKSRIVTSRARILKSQSWTSTGTKWDYPILFYGFTRNDAKSSRVCVFFKLMLLTVESALSNLGNRNKVFYAQFVRFINNVIGLLPPSLPEPKRADVHFEADSVQFHAERARALLIRHNKYFIYTLPLHGP